MNPKEKGLFRGKFFVCLVVMICLLLTFLLPVSNTGAISIEDEQKRGEQAALYGQYTDAVMDSGFAKQYFNAMGQYVIQAIETKHFAFNFYVINNNTVNAFATFAGHIFFYTGLINIMDNADELAAVLCHEVSHVAARHISKSMDRQKKVLIAQLAGVLAGALVGGDAASGLIIGSAAAGQQAQINYTRDNERQADQMGIKYIKEAGFDPRAMITVFKKFDDMRRLSPYADKIPPYLMTHPLDSERMSNVDAMLKDYSPRNPGKEVIQFREQFPFFQAIVRAKSIETHQAEKLFLTELEQNPDSASSHFGLGIVYTEGTEYDKALFHLRKAQKERPEFAPILTNLGKAYQRKGEHRKAIPILKKAMKLDEQDNSIPLLMGVSYESVGEYDEAIRLFKRLTYLPPVDNEVYYHLGFSYGKQDRLALAHYNFGIYYKNWRSVKKAQFHFQKAFNLAKDDPAMRKKIRLEQEDLRKNYPRQNRSG